MAINQHLVGKEVKVNQKGPDSVEGTVLGVFSDYIVIEDKKGSVQYIRLYHIKNITENLRKSAKKSRNEPEFIEAENFKDLLEQSIYYWVDIRVGGPERVEGILEQVTDKYIAIVKKHDYIQIPVHHVRSINFSEKSSEEESEVKK